MRQFVFLFCSIVFIFSSCEKNDPEIPDGYTFLIGDWHTYSFEVDHNIGSAYFYTETFDSTQIPYQLKVSLEENRWEVMFDNTFICGRKIEGFEFPDSNNPRGYLLDGRGNRKFEISYQSIDSTICFYGDFGSSGGLGNNMTVFFLRRNN